MINKINYIYHNSSLIKNYLVSTTWPYATVVKHLNKNYVFSIIGYASPSKNSNKTKAQSPLLSDYFSPIIYFKLICFSIFNNYKIGLYPKLAVVGPGNREILAQNWFISGIFIFGSVIIFTAL